MKQQKCKRLPSTATKAELMAAHRTEMVERRARQLALSERMAARSVPSDVWRVQCTKHKQTREIARRQRQARGAPA